MPQSDVDVDIQALKDFNTDIGALLDKMNKDPGLQSSLAAVDTGKAKPPLTFGEDMFPYAQFSSAYELKKLYDGQFGDWHKNYQSLQSSLTLLATVASELATNYDTAKDLDAVSAKTVDDTFNAAQVPAPTPTTTT